MNAKASLIVGIVAEPPYGRVRVGVVEDVERAFAVAHREVEYHAGLGFLDGHRHVAVIRVPEKADADAVGDAAVELASALLRS